MFENYGMQCLPGEYYNYLRLYYYQDRNIGLWLQFPKAVLQKLNLDSEYVLTLLVNSSRLILNSQGLGCLDML